MDISSTGGTGSLSFALTGHVKSRQRLDQFEAPSSAATDMASTGMDPSPPRTGGLLSSINVREVLNLTDTPPADVNSLTGPLSGREFLGDLIKRSEAAYAAGGSANLNSLTNRYTQKDVDVIHAATGYNLVVTNNLTTVVDDSGNPPPSGMAMQVLNLSGSIEMARLGGAIDGEMTPNDLRSVFEGLSAGGASLPKDWLYKALDYLEATVDS